MRLAVATRSMNDVLYRACDDLLGLDRACAQAGVTWERHRLTGTDGFGYFRELLRLDADFVINLDEDAFVLDPSRLVGLVRTMEAGGHAACGMPDGGVVFIRRHNPAVCNAFFNVFDLRRVRPVWSDWARVVAATHKPEYEARVAAFTRRSAFAFDHFERYYGAFFALLDAGEHILALDAETWQDGVSTLLKDAAGEPLLIHCWYTRHWESSYHTRQRCQAVIDYARQVQGRGPAESDTSLKRQRRIPLRLRFRLVADPPAPSIQGRGPVESGPRAERNQLHNNPGRSATMPAPLKNTPSVNGFLPHLLECIPPSARRVLDVGCGTGALGQALKARQPVEVWGVAIDEEAARIARAQLDQVLVGDLEEGESWAPMEPYDCIVCEEGLACLREPARWLRRAHAALAPGGFLLAAIANVRHHAVVEALLQGRWQREPVGPSRRPPLRFFTRREIEKLFYRAGFSIRRLEGVPGPGDEEALRNGRPPALKIGRLDLGGFAPAAAEEFHIGHYLVEAVPVAPADFGRTSIVIVTHNQLSFTRVCVDSILQYTDEPYELIFVDNGSNDGTPAYLESLPQATVIRNPDNRGFPAAANQGIRAATGQQVLLLNNDIVVTTGWLGRLLRALHSEEKLGLVGPSSNYVSGEQQVEIGYDDLAQLDGFAWDWGKANNRVREDTDRLVGFCLLIRREVIDRVGLLDERFGIGCFEDDDYCRRVLRAGYRAVIARDAFVHHFGGRTFAGNRIDFAGLMEKNERLFCEKWEHDGAAEQGAVPAAPEAPLPRPGAYRVRIAPGGGLLLGREGIDLSMCMIVRDNARTIGPALESARQVADELVVVDTGSKDETPEIARRLGARVFHFPWCDSFSAARNESLRHARGRWIFWMDSDDVIDPDNARQLRELIARAAGLPFMGYIVSVHCPGPRSDDDVTVVQHVKLFPNFPQLRFDGRIHEQIIPAINALGGDLGWTDLFVVHAGYDHTPEGQQRKLARDLRLLHLELDERPDHPFTLFNLAMTYTDSGSYEDGLRFARRCIARSHQGASHVRKAYAFRVTCHERLGQQEEAWQACVEGLRQFPLDDELRFRKGVLLHAQGSLPEAVQAYLDLLARREEAHFSSKVAGIAGHLARHNLALVYRDLGDLGAEEEQWRRVVEEKPHYRPGWRALGDVLVRSHQEAAARAVAERLLRDPRLHGEGRCLLSALAAARGDGAAARRELERGVVECPNDLEPLRELCLFLFQHAAPADAERALRELARREPDNASVQQNLGTICLRLHRPQEAVEAYRQALVHGPDRAETHLYLGYALNDAGRREEALQAWEAALRLDPGNQLAREELEKARRPRPS